MLAAMAARETVARELAVEVAVVGGGLVGLTLAVALAGLGLPVAAVDREDPKRLVGLAFDGRASAIARGSQQALAALGIWQQVAEAAPILEIRVSDGRIGEAASALYLHYDSRELGAGPFGWIAENRLLRIALQARAEALPELRLLAPAALAEAERGAEGVRLRLADGRRITCRLLVAADGKDSPLRQAAGIGLTRWDYPQTGIVATIRHGLSHQGVAHEHFLPSGPFAVLPLPDLPDGTHRSSLVWTERRELAAAMLALEDKDFAREVLRRFGDSLGCLAVEGQRWSYPLSLQHAARYGAHRLALIGDAAHVIHPIAGQGFNLGIRDAAALAECLAERCRLGLDPGAPEVIGRYEDWRRTDTLALIAVTDGLNRLFSNDIAPLRLARDLGLAAVNHLGPLRRFFMQHAMGLSGDLPRLIKGQPL